MQLISLIKRLHQPILATVAGLLVFTTLGYWMLSFSDRQEKISVVVAARDLAAPKILEEADLKIAKRPRGDLPKNALADIQAVVGFALVYPLTEKEILTTSHFLPDIDARSASLIIPAGLAGFSLPVSWLAGAPPDLVKGDQITILSSAADKSVEKGTAILGESIPILEITTGKNNEAAALLLGVDLFQAASLLQAKANRLALGIILEAPPRPEETEKE